MNATLSSLVSSLAFIVVTIVGASPSRATPAASSPDSACGAPHIQAHLAAVERELVAADTSQLTPEVAARRAHHIAVLAAYREACRFPVNDVARDRLVPIFVDAAGTPCAMAHLLTEDGQGALVAHIAATRNTASVWELGDEPALAAWLADNGLTLYEAARIQPSYCFMNRGGTCLCADTAADVLGLAEGVIVAAPEGSGQVDVRVESVHGTGAVTGDIRRVNAVDGDVVGRRALIVVWRYDAGEAYTVRGPEREGDRVQCTSGRSPDPSYCANVDYDLYVEALFAEDCLARLAVDEPHLAVSVCDLGGAACGAPSDDDGCAGGGPHAAWPALATLVALVARARRRGATSER